MGKKGDRGSEIEIGIEIGIGSDGKHDTAWNNCAHLRANVHQAEVVRKGCRFPNLPPIRIGRASRRGRGGVLDLAMGVGRGTALIPTLLGILSDTVFSRPRRLQKTAPTYLQSPSQ